jgi:hypothetical protein
VDSNAFERGVATVDEAERKALVSAVLEPSAHLGLASRCDLARGIEVAAAPCQKGNETNCGDR